MPRAHTPPAVWTACVTGAPSRHVSPRLVAQIHDELLFEVEEAQVPEFAGERRAQQGFRLGIVEASARVGSQASSLPRAVCHWDPGRQRGQPGPGTLKRPRALPGAGLQLQVPQEGGVAAGPPGLVGARPWSRQRDWCWGTLASGLCALQARAPQHPPWGVTTYRLSVLSLPSLQGGPGFLPPNTGASSGVHPPWPVPLLSWEGEGGT